MTVFTSFLFQSQNYSKEKKLKLSIEKDDMTLLIEMETKTTFFRVPFSLSLIVMVVGYRMSQNSQNLRRKNKKHKTELVFNSTNYEVSLRIFKIRPRKEKKKFQMKLSKKLQLELIGSWSTNTFITFSYRGFSCYFVNENWEPMIQFAHFDTALRYTNFHASFFLIKSTSTSDASDVKNNNNIIVIVT